MIQLTKEEILPLLFYNYPTKEKDPTGTSYYDTIYFISDPYYVLRTTTDGTTYYEYDYRSGTWSS